MPFVNRTRAILRRAELGFFGVMVLTCKQTPRLNGEPFGSQTGLFLRTLKLRSKAGAFDFLILWRRRFRINWLSVGTKANVKLKVKSVKFWSRFATAFKKPSPQAIPILLPLHFKF